MELSSEQWSEIWHKYAGMFPILSKNGYVEGVPYCGNKIYIMYKFPDGYAIYEIIGRKRYELKEIIGSVPKELLKGLDHDANHRAWISKEYNTKTPFLAFDKRKKYRLKRAWNRFILKLADLKIINPEKTKSWMIPIR